MKILKKTIKSILFNESTNKNYSFKEIFKIIWDNVYDLGTRISSHQLFILAGGIAFNVLLYIIPLVLIFVYFINIFIEPTELIKYIQTALMDFLPKTELSSEIFGSVLSEIQRIADTSMVAGIVGFFILLWISSAIISTLNNCISMIFKVKQPDYIRTKLKDLGTTILLNILILLYCVLIPIANVATSLVNSMFPDFLTEYVSHATIVITQFIVSFLLFYFIYLIVPANKTSDKNHRRVAYMATVIAVIATELARNLFTWYISSVSNYSRFYGTYAVLITMAIWLYYSCFIILFSAELAQFIGDKRQARLNLETETHNITINNNLVAKQPNKNNVNKSNKKRTVKHKK